MANSEISALRTRLEDMKGVQVQQQQVAAVAVAESDFLREQLQESTVAGGNLEGRCKELEAALQVRCGISHRTMPYFGGLSKDEINGCMQLKASRRGSLISC